MVHILESEQMGLGAGLEATAEYTIQIDTGGTFTDAYVTGNGKVLTAKVDTTPHDLAVGVLDAIEQAAKQLDMKTSRFLEATEIIRLSTTVGTNTLINRDGPRLGLIHSMSSTESLDALPENLPLEPELCIPLEDNLDSLNERALQANVRTLLERGARIIVIALAGGGDYVTQESRVREIIAESYPRHYLGAVPVLASHQITPLTDDRLRIQTAVLNAYLHPVMSRFLYKVEDSLRDAGYSRPLLIANASGGTSRVSKTAALRTWGSGPAGGVIATTLMANELHLPVAVGYDIGGTSTDIVVVRDGQAKYDVQPEIDGIHVALPTLSLTSAAIGGGTIARVVDGILQLGPDSAGAQPGPASFGLGGANATVTDAICFLGFITPDTFLGGRKTLDIEEAAATIKVNIAEPLGVDEKTAAWRIISEAAMIIASAIQHEVELNQVAQEDVALVATGGAGGMLASFVHSAYGNAGRSYAFNISPVFSAFGLSRLGVQHDYEISGHDSAEHIAEALDTVRARSILDMNSEGFSEAEINFRYELEIVKEDSVEVEHVSSAEAVQGLLSAGVRPRLIRLIADCENPVADLPSAGDSELFETSVRAVAWDPQPHGGTSVFDWNSARLGSTACGPAIFETQETTLIVAPNLQATVGRLGEIRINSIQGEAR